MEKWRNIALDVQACADELEALLAGGPDNPIQLLIDAQTKPLHAEIERLRAEQERCDHKFVDSKKCLKCGLDEEDIRRAERRRRGVPEPPAAIPWPDEKP
jgi:hypothetical protein